LTDIPDSIILHHHCAGDREKGDNLHIFKIDNPNSVTSNHFHSAEHNTPKESDL
jgi:hypothetical protein